MPLVLDPVRWGRERLRDALRQQVDGVEEIRARITGTDLPWSDPTSLRTAIDLVEDAQALARAVLEATEPPLDELARVVNLHYDVLLAAVDLMKAHGGLPKVPRPGRPATPT